MHHNRSLADSLQVPSLPPTERTHIFLGELLPRFGLLHAADAESSALSLSTNLDHSISVSDKINQCYVES